MISKFDEIEKLFEDLDKSMNSKVKIFVIGGAVLLHQGLKPATKDIDLVVNNEEEYRLFENVLKKSGFIGKIPTKEYKAMNISQIYVREDFRIDLFLKTVCKGFSLSEGMIKRAKKASSFTNIALHLCSNEDIFMFKTMTEREGDLDDCIALARRGLDWNAIINELKAQMKMSGKDVWITYIGERMDILVERGLNIPIMKDINRLRKGFFEKQEKRMN